MSTETKHNPEKEKEFDKIRAERRKKAFGIKSEEEETKENSKKSEEKLDNEENNDYIVDDEPDSSDEADENQERLKKIIEQNFQGDPLKLAKSYLASQSEYTKLRNEHLETQKKLQKYSQMIENSPTLKKAIENAKSMEEIESLLSSQKESQDKPKSVEKETSKLNLPSKVEPEELIEKGYIDGTYFENLSDIEKKAVIQRAELNYLQAELPKIIAERTAEESSRRIAEIEKQKKQREIQEKNEQLNLKRYEDGIVSVVEKYGLDFAGNEEHKKLLDEIDAEVVGIRDRENPHVIKPEAVEIATQLVLSRNNMLEEQKQKAQERQKELDKAKSFNVNKKQTRPKREPTTLAEKLRARKIEEYENKMSRGIPKRKQEIIKNY